MLLYVVVNFKLAAFARAIIFGAVKILYGTIFCIILSMVLVEVLMRENDMVCL